MSRMCFVVLDSSSRSSTEIATPLKPEPPVRGRAKLPIVLKTPMSTTTRVISSIIRAIPSCTGIGTIAITGHRSAPVWVHGGQIARLVRHTTITVRTSPVVMSTITGQLLVLTFLKPSSSFIIY